MKKILLLLLLISGYCHAQTYPPRYTGINHSYVWPNGIFRTGLHAPSGASAALTTGQWTGAGALFVDTSGGGIGLYYYNGLNWIRLRDTTEAGGGGSGTVTSVATGYGLSGGTITTSGTLVADTAVGAGLFPWQRWLKVRDSLAAVLSGISGSPGGSNTQYQYNNSSAFGGTNMTYNNSTGATTLTGSSNTPQFKILAHSGQTNSNPIFQLRTSADGDLLDIHSDYYTNLFLGVAAGSNNAFVLNTAGYDNSFIGYAAGNKNTTGYLNTVMGKRAFTENLAGVQNSAFGAGALQNSLSNFNTAVGYHSQFGLTSGNSNTSVGTEALLYDSSGLQNTAVGRSALQNGTSGSFNTAVGAYSLVSSNGGSNTCVGINTLYSNTAGTGNVAMGVNAGYGATGSYNVFLGRQSGRGITGDQNVIIGDNTGYNASSRSNRLMIDNSSTNNPLIDGDFAADTLTINGSLGVGAAPVASSLLNLSSTTKGFLTPRMTATQRTSISSPATGLEVYDTDSLKKFVYNGSAWKSLANTTDIPAVSTPTLQQVLTAGPDLTTDHALDFGGNNVSIDGGNVISISSNGAGTGSQRVEFNAVNSTNGQSSRLEVWGDSIIVKPGTGGVISIDSLRTLAAGDDEMMTWNPRTKVVSHQAIPSGGSLTIGTSPITSGSTKRILYDSAGTLSSNASLAWDIANKRLGVGTDAPTFAIHQYENTTETTNAGIKIENAGNGDAAIHFARASTNYTIGLDQSNSSRFYISASTALGTNNGVIVASDGKVGLNGAAPAAGVTFGAGSASAFSAPTKYTSGTLNTTAEAGANEYNGNFYDTKVNAVRFARGGTLNVNTTDVGNVGTGVDDLQSFPVPAGALSADGDFMEYEFVITFAANANNKTVRVVYGATEVYNSTAQAQNGGTMIISGRIVRTSATTQDVTARVSVDGTLYTDIANYTTAAETLSGAVILKDTGEATSDNDIISKILTVKFGATN